MPKKIKVYYANVPNMGDILNRDIIKQCFGYDVTRRSYLTGDLSGIGSGLGHYTYEEENYKNILKQIFGILKPKVYIWGTGFIDKREKDRKFVKKKIEFCAVRGRLSLARVEKLVGKKLDIALGDAGILASYLVEGEQIEKKYDVGIIAHFKEQEEPVFKELLERFPNSTFVDVRQQPMDVVRKIAECRTTISSSLHGLIISDSLNIPNRHIVVTNRLLGDGYKFEDYYSAYGLKHEYTDMRTSTIESLDEVCSSYRVTKEMTDKMKKDMLEAFPYPSMKILK